MKKSTYSILAIILGCGCIAGLLWHNHRLAEIYQAADGKTKALFGIVELSRLGYKLWLIPLLLLSSFFSYKASKCKENKWLFWISIGLIVIAIILFPLSLWKRML